MWSSSSSSPRSLKHHNFSTDIIVIDSLVSQISRWVIDWKMMYNESSFFHYFLTCWHCHCFHTTSCSNTLIVPSSSSTNIIYSSSSSLSYLLPCHIQHDRHCRHCVIADQLSSSLVLIIINHHLHHHHCHHIIIVVTTTQQLTSIVCRSNVRPHTTVGRQTIIGELHLFE